MLEELVKLLLARLGDKLVSVVVYGSVARRTAGPESDIDILIITEDVPKSRLRRQEMFLNIERGFEHMLEGLWSRGFYVDFSPIILTPREASRLRPIYLDMVEDSIMLYDRDGFFSKVLNRLKRKLRQLGSKRVWIGDKWYWILKPDIKFGEVVEIE